MWCWHTLKDIASEIKNSTLWVWHRFFVIPTIRSLIKQPSWVGAKPMRAIVWHSFSSCIIASSYNNRIELIKHASSKGSPFSLQAKAKCLYAFLLSLRRSSACSRYTKQFSSHTQPFLSVSSCSQRALIYHSYSFRWIKPFQIWITSKHPPLPIKESGSGKAISVDMRKKLSCFNLIQGDVLVVFRFFVSFLDKKRNNVESWESFFKN